MKSRTFNSLKNIQVALLFYVLNLVLQFYSRAVFLEYLGTEILGLNTTTLNMMQFLNLAELGIASGIGFTLYKPISNNDYDAINEIVTLEGYLLKFIGALILVCAGVLICFFPLIFSKMDLPLWYAYLSFFPMILTASLGYFFNYKQVVLSANQQEYKIKYGYQSVMLVKTLAQIILVKNLGHPFYWWVLCEVAFAIVASINLNIIIKKSAPFLRKSKKTLSQLRRQYKNFEVKIKQLFFHKMGYFVITQTSPLIIYAYLSLTDVALYGNYMIMSTGLMSLNNAVFNGMGASVGNLIALSDKEKVKSVFEELFVVRLFMSSFMCFILAFFGQYFISFWIGKEYLLSQTSLWLISSILFVNLIRSVSEQFLYAYELVKDIWAPIAEVTINVGLSLILGKIYGLNGILLGVLVSLVVIPLIWKGSFLYHSGLKINFIKYLALTIKALSIVLVTFIITFILISEKGEIRISNIGELIIEVLKASCFYIVIGSVLMFSIHRGFRNFVFRMIIVLRLGRKNRIH